MRGGALWYVAALVAGSAWPAASSASAQDTLTLREAIAAALAQHPSAAAAAAELARAEAVVDEVGASLLPAVTVDGMLTRFQEPMVVAPLHGFDARNPPVFDRTLAQASIGVGWWAVDGGSRRARRTAAEAGVVAAAASQSAAEQSLVAEVVRWYAAVVTTRELAQAHAARVAALEAERVRAAQLLEQGRAPRLAVLRAEAALSGASAEASTAAENAAAAERELARLTALAPETVRRASLVEVRLPAPPTVRDAYLSHAVDGSPELRALDARVQAAHAHVSEARAQWWPQLQLGGRYVRYGSGSGDEGGEWQTGVQLSYPLFAGGSRPAALARAQAETRRASAERALGELRLAAAADAALSAYTAASARADAWSAAVSQSEEVARIERLLLDTGAGVQTDYLAAEAELLRARAAWTEARFAALRARLELARLAGTLTQAWIDANVESDR
jgi:outer membrane protein TolC